MKKKVEVAMEGVFIVPVFRFCSAKYVVRLTTTSTILEV